jgi:Icc protein
MSKKVRIDGPASLPRRHFLRTAGAAAGAVFAGSLLPASALPGFGGSLAPATPGGGGTTPPGAAGGFRFAYISDSHLYEKSVNDGFVRALLRAVEDVNALDPQPDFVLYGGDLAQLGRPEQLDLGTGILRNVRAPLRMMVGEHDWFFDLGEHWRKSFGEPYYSFDHKGVHFVTLLSIVERDFWTPAGLTPGERMQTVAGLDNQRQSAFSVGDEQRAWLAQDLEAQAVDKPIIVFSHSPLYKLYRGWNFWTDDAEHVQALLARFQSVVVVHGHTHQVLTNRIGNMHFHGMLSTAWPWPYPPEGVPELTVRMNRPDPFNENDGCGHGEVVVHPDGRVDKIYSAWNRSPMTVSREYLLSQGAQDRPLGPSLPSY